MVVQVHTYTSPGINLHVAPPTFAPRTQASLHSWKNWPLRALLCRETQFVKAGGYEGWTHGRWGQTWCWILCATSQSTLDLPVQHCCSQSRLTTCAEQLFRVCKLPFLGAISFRDQTSAGVTQEGGVLALLARLKIIAATHFS